MSSPDDSPSALGPLLARHKAGDPAVVTEIIVHCQDRFVRLARVMLGRYVNIPLDVETGDVVNELVVRLMTALQQKTFDGPAQFLRYASRCMRSNLIDLAKKCRPIPAGGPGSNSSDPNLLGAIPDSTNEPEKLAQWGEIHALIDQLPDDERVLFDLLFYQELSRAEAAELLGLPLTTLRTRWLRAQANLMRLLGNNTPF